MKNASNAKYLLVGKYGTKNDPAWKFEVLKASKNRDELNEKMNKIDVGNSKFSCIKILAPKEEF